MDQRDLADLHAHPEWFDVRPVFVSRVGLPTTGSRDALDLIINPPVCIVRKPVPFVLPIRGSAL